MSVLEHPKWTAGHPKVHRLVRETMIIGGLFLLYNVGRVLAARDTGAAFHNAWTVWHLERAFHLPNEQVFQSWVLRWPDLVRLINAYYANVHFPLTFSVLAWLVLRRPAVYAWVRTALVSATSVALLIAFVLPVAPPRMMTSLGFVDTGALYGQSVYDSAAGSNVANQFAAMPSLHVGWALLVAMAMISATRSRWRWLWVAHPIITTLVVVLTANHYWLDGILGAGLVLAGTAITPRSVLRRRDRPVRRTTRRSQPVAASFDVPAQTTHYTSHGQARRAWLSDEGGDRRRPVLAPNRVPDGGIWDASYYVIRKPWPAWSML